MVRTAALVVALSACSYATVTRAPRQPAPGRPMDCTRRPVAPVVDVVVAVPPSALAVFGFALAVETPTVGQECLLCSKQEFLAFGVVSALVALPWWLSARHGFRETARCRELTATSG